MGGEWFDLGPDAVGHVQAAIALLGATTVSALPRRLYPTRRTDRELADLTNPGDGCVKPWAERRWTPCAHRECRTPKS
jgi:hypothetical protein